MLGGSQDFQRTFSFQDQKITLVVNDLETELPADVVLADGGQEGLSQRRRFALMMQRHASSRRQAGVSSVGGVPLLPRL